MVANLRLPNKPGVFVVICFASAVQSRFDCIIKMGLDGKGQIDTDLLGDCTGRPQICQKLFLHTQHIAAARIFETAGAAEQPDLYSIHTCLFDIIETAAQRFCIKLTRGAGRRGIAQTAGDGIIVYTVYEAVIRQQLLIDGTLGGLSGILHTVHRGITHSCGQHNPR